MINRKGNVVELKNTADDEISLATEGASATNEYIYEVSGLQTADSARIRFDKCIDSPQGETIVWKIYDAYTYKWEILAYEDKDALTTNTATKSFNARSYGVLSSAFAGFKGIAKSLFVIGIDYEEDNSMYPVDDVHPIELGNGLWSLPYLVMTA